MKITGAKVIVCSPSRNFVTLKLETDQGIYGLGDATLNGREKAVASFLEDHCIPALIGRDPRKIEDTWQYFYRGVYWQRGAVTMTALAAIDVALWDIKGKLLGAPLYELLGGKSRERVLVYAHASGRGLSETVEDVGRAIAQGFQAVRVQAGVPGVPDAYGVPKDGLPYEPAGRGLPREECWDTGKYLGFAPRLLEAVRSAYGSEVHLLHDAHHRLKPIEAARLARELEPYHLFWLEDPIPCELERGLRVVREHSTTPIATGEVMSSVFDATTLITEQLIDYLRMTVVHAGGISHIMKVAGFASFYQVELGFHGATDLSPVNLAASLHVDLAINNFGIQEYMPHAPIVSEVFRTGYRYEDGHLLLDAAPGLGVDIDEAAAARYPYSMASLPVARRVDGTLVHW